MEKGQGVFVSSLSRGEFHSLKIDALNPLP